MQNTTFSIVMPEGLRTFVEERMRSTHFGNVSEYFRHLVREDQKQAARDRLETLLLEGEASGAPVTADDEWWARKKAQLLAQAKRGKAS